MRQLLPLLVRNSIHEGDDYFSIVFQKPPDFTFLPGECFNLHIKSEQFQEARIFSFSSSPTEDDLMITYKKGISTYKHYLHLLKTGETVFLEPYGTQYTFNFSQPIVCIAGGIGIAVFRSALKYARDTNVQTPIRLIYVNRGDEFPFRSELEEWGTQLTLSVSYINTLISPRLTRESLSPLLPQDHKDQLFYLAGPPAMIDTTEEQLLSLGVKQNAINTDSFDGYTGDA